MKYSAAVIGLGYVGLPLAVLLKKKKIKIFGFDSNIEVVKKIKQNFPDVEVDEVEVLKTTSENTIQINITYSIPNTGINDTLELNFA